MNPDLILAEASIEIALNKVKKSTDDLKSAMIYERGFLLWQLYRAPWWSIFLSEKGLRKCYKKRFPYQKLEELNNFK